MTSCHLHFGSNIPGAPTCKRLGVTASSEPDLTARLPIPELVIAPDETTLGRLQPLAVRAVCGDADGAGTGCQVLSVPA